MVSNIPEMYHTRYTLQLTLCRSLHKVNSFFQIEVEVQLRV